MTLTDIYEYFYALIHLSLHGDSKVVHLGDVTPSRDDWESIFRFAKKQALVGILFCGVQVLKKMKPEKCENLTHELYMQWLGFSARIQRQNEILDERCKDLYERLKVDGYQSCVLKGQSYAALYATECAYVGQKSFDLSSYRQPGDIDIWMIASPTDSIEWARRTGRLECYDYHHAEISIFPEVDVELHYRPSISRNLVRNARLQTWFYKEGGKHIIYNNQLGYNVPDATFSVVLALNHNLWHLLYEGVGLRQMMDLYFATIAYAASNDSYNKYLNIHSYVGGESISKCCTEADCLIHLIKCFKLEMFAAASSWVMWHVFDGESEDSLFVKEESPLPKPDAKAGAFLLNEIMQSGNFGHYDARVQGIKRSNVLKLMFFWVKHAFRLVKYYPVDVLWTPIGVLRISLWRRWRYRKDCYLNK